MNDLRPTARPVDVALPPRATVTAERAALLPPDRCLNINIDKDIQAYFRYVR